MVGSITIGVSHARDKKRKSLLFGRGLIVWTSLGTNGEVHDAVERHVFVHLLEDVSLGDVDVVLASVDVGTHLLGRLGESIELNVHVNVDLLALGGFLLVDADHRDGRVDNYACGNGSDDDVGLLGVLLGHDNGLSMEWVGSHYNPSFRRERQKST